MSPIAPSAASSNAQVNVEGTIADPHGTCPNLSFEMGGERVVTSGETQFRGVECIAIQNGTTGEVDGLRQPDGRVLAREVHATPAGSTPGAPPPGPQVPGPQQQVEGFLSDLSGACPDLTFRIGSTRVRTTGTTEFNRIPCGSFENGMDVEVEGAAQADGVVLARQLSPDETQIEGRLANLGGACPDRSFTVEGQRVFTLLTTRFDDTTCTTLQDGLQVEVRGVRRSNGSLFATRVRREDPPQQNQEVRVTGSLSDLQGACPARTFVVAGERVVTHAGTRFDDVSCGGLAAGLRVEVRGVRQSNGSVLADRVKRED